MSKKETWRTRLYWEIVGGFLVEEFNATKLDRAAGVARRLIDGVIISGEEFGSQIGGSRDIIGKDIIAIQTKGTRLSMGLMGQALFSRDLLEKHNPRSVESVAICASGDSVLEEIADKHNIKVVIIPDGLQSDEKLITELRRELT